MSFDDTTLPLNSRFTSKKKSLGEIAESRGTKRASEDTSGQYTSLQQSTRISGGIRMTKKGVNGESSLEVISKSTNQLADSSQHYGYGQRLDTSMSLEQLTKDVKSPKIKSSDRQAEFEFHEQKQRQLYLEHVSHVIETAKLANERLFTENVLGQRVYKGLKPLEY